MTSVLDELYIQNLELGRERLRKAKQNYKQSIKELGQYQSLLGSNSISKEGKAVVRKAISIQLGNVNRDRAEWVNSIRNLEILLARKPRPIVRRKRAVKSLQRSGTDSYRGTSR
jgi:hypothetical protein